jgi:hypothetical protein
LSRAARWSIGFFLGKASLGRWVGYGWFDRGPAHAAQQAALAIHRHRFNFAVGANLKSNRLDLGMRRLIQILRGGNIRSQDQQGETHRKPKLPHRTSLPVHQIQFPKTSP